MAAVKYKNRREYLDFYAEAIARRYGYFFKHRKDAVLVPVPVHPARLRSRGFNQAGELAVRLGRLTGLLVNERLLVRTRKTAPQKELGPDERLRNLRHAFAVAAEFRWEPAPGKPDSRNLPGWVSGCCHSGLLRSSHADDKKLDLHGGHPCPCLRLPGRNSGDAAGHGGQ